MNILKLGLNTLEMTNRGVFKDEDNFDSLFEFNEVFKTAVFLEPNLDAYIPISFSQVTSPFLVIISAERPISAKINGVEFTNTKKLVLNIPIESIELFNPGIYKIETEVAVYGVK